MMHRSGIVLLGLLFSAQSSLHAQEKPGDEKFDVLEYRVLGSTLLPRQEVERAVYPHLGPGKDIATVEAARQALERAYRDQGFGTVFVDIPEQDVDNGIVRLRVTEGRIDRVRISGARYFSARKIRAELPSVRTGTAPQLPQLQAEINTLNSQTRDRAITPILKAGRTPGTVDIDLKVEDGLPVHGSLEVNDRYTADTTRTRALLNLSYDNLFQLRHSLSLQYQTAPEERSEAQVFAATYVAPLGDSGRLLALYGVDTDSDVATVGTLSVLGKGQILGARLIQPLPSASAFSQSLSFGFDYKDFSENVQLTPDTGLQTPISYLHSALQYNGNQRSERASTAFNMGAGLGFRSGMNSELEFENKRFLARGNYFYLRGSVQQERQALWGLRLFGRLGGQFAVEPLVSNEQFAIGGLDSVRGYLESEQLGDSGLSGALELRSPPLTRWLGSHGAASYFYGFFDAGVVSILEPLPAQRRRTDLSSAGLGFRAFAFHGIDADLTWAYPLVPGSHVEEGDSRVHMLMRYSF